MVVDESRAFGWPQVLLVLLVALVFVNTLDNGWHFDDHHSIVENEAIRSLRNIPAFFTDPTTFSGRTGEKGMYRPVLLVGYALTYALGGLSLPLWHAVQLVLHLACVLVVHRLFRGLGASSGSSFLAAGLFAVHPIQTQALNYLSSRSEIQMSLFLCLSLLLAQDGACGTGGSQRLRTAGSLLCLVLALLTKSVAVVAPVLVMLQWLVAGAGRGGSGRSKLRGALGAVLPHVAVVAGYLVLRRLLFGFFLAPAFEGGSDRGRPLATNLLAQASVLWLYLRLILVPVGQSIIHDLATSPSLVAWPTVAAVPATLSLLAGFVALRRRWALASFGGLFFFVMLVPTSLVPLVLLVNEHRVYLAAAGLFLGFAVGLEALLGRYSWGRRGFVVATAVLLVACGVGSWARNRIWANDLTLWGDAVAKAPQGYFVRLEFASAMAHAGLSEEALLEYGRWHRQFRVVDDTVFTNAGFVAVSQGYPHLARRYLEPLLTSQGRERIRASRTWALLLVLAGLPDQGLSRIEALAAEHPSSADLAQYREHIRALVEGRRARLEGARLALGQGGEDDPEARFALAAALDAAGQRREAHSEYEAGLSRWPEAVPALVAYADLLGRDGRWVEAGDRSAAALRLAPTNGRALELLACAQGALKRDGEARLTARRLLDLTGRVSAEVRWFVGLPPFGDAPADWPLREP